VSELTPAVAGNSDLNEDQLISIIKTHIAKGDKAKDKAEQHYISAGQYLSQLKGISPDQVTFLATVKDKIGLGKSRAYELLQIADGRKTDAEVREATNQRKIKHRASVPERTRGNNIDANQAADERRAYYAATEEPDTEAGDDDQTIWRRGLVYRAERAAEQAAFEDWSGFTIDGELIRVVEQAAAAWNDTAAYLNGLRAEQRSAAAHDDGLDIPEYLRRSAS